jgi:hypothetical protein
VQAPANEGDVVPSKERPVLCTVSTVRDSLEHIELFVRRNLASGADHMFIFLEGAEEDHLRFLEEHRHVTVFNADVGFWHGQVPVNLNTRQVRNANLVNYALAQVPSVQWLFHIDADECLEIDRERLVGLGPEVPYVHLAPKEHVSSRHPAKRELFKRKLGANELALLHVRGVIDQPKNSELFRGHVRGKSGLRPSLGWGFRVHDAIPLEGDPLPPLTAPWLSMLHYESTTLEEFVRKSRTMSESGKRTRFRRHRDLTRKAALAIISNPVLDDAQRIEYLHHVYETCIEDDVAQLLELGFLDEPVAVRHTHHPQPLSEGDRAALDSILRGLLTADKGYFQPGRHDLSPADLVPRTARGARSVLTRRGHQAHTTNSPSPRPNPPPRSRSQ